MCKDNRRERKNWHKIKQQKVMQFNMALSVTISMNYFRISLPTWLIFKDELPLNSLVFSPSFSNLLYVYECVLCRYTFFIISYLLNEWWWWAKFIEKIDTYVHEYVEKCEKIYFDKKSDAGDGGENVIMWLA